MWQPNDTHVTIIVGLLLWLTKIYFFQKWWKRTTSQNKKDGTAASANWTPPSDTGQIRETGCLSWFLFLLRFCSFFIIFLLLALTRVFWRFLSCIIISTVKKKCNRKNKIFFSFWYRKKKKRWVTSWPSYMTFLFEMIFGGFFFSSFKRLATPSTLGWRGRWIFSPSPPVTSHFSTPESPGNNDAI